MLTSTEMCLDTTWFIKRLQRNNSYRIDIKLEFIVKSKRDNGYLWAI